MHQINEILIRVESKRLWGYFHKDWLIQIRQSLRSQIPSTFRVFVESEAVLITPESAGPVATNLPDISVGRLDSDSLGDSRFAAEATAAVVDVEELCESETHYQLVIRRSPENRIVAVLELLSPSNKGVGNRFDQERHLRKRDDFIAAGINLLEIDALSEGHRDLPTALTPLNGFERLAWTVNADQDKRRFRGWGWNADQSPPTIDWQLDASVGALVDLSATAKEAIDFNNWDELASE
ncbi:DUF4058 family protein [Stratiformator vulcanicus]|uniref:Uncharacterized protein n=1 Tax=Stratiformator vulcanicus TaxID=2527980 RepID=A0A517R7I6_9PLAN|nr:DUF4058 family protein [Stratiformator vulcanicus]QDT39846.1 hypothetical protein Pan189_42580 [Stratiformator vulcanicus]